MTAISAMLLNTDLCCTRYMSMSLILNIWLFKMMKSITFCVMQIRVIFAPLFGAPLPWCPGQLPQSPTPQSTTAPARCCNVTELLLLSAMVAVGERWQAGVLSARYHLQQARRLYAEQCNAPKTVGDSVSTVWLVNSLIYNVVVSSAVQSFLSSHIWTVPIPKYKKKNKSIGNIRKRFAEFIVFDF